MADGDRESDSDDAKGPEARRTHSAQAARNRLRGRYAWQTLVRLPLPALPAGCGAGQHAKNDSSIDAEHAERHGTSTLGFDSARKQRRMNGGSGQKAFPSFALRTQSHGYRSPVAAVLVWRGLRCALLRL